MDKELFIRAEKNETGGGFIAISSDWAYPDIWILTEYEPMDNSLNMRLNDVTMAALGIRKGDGRCSQWEMSLVGNEPNVVWF